MIEKTRNGVYRLLRWSERYTKTDMLYLTKGGFWVSFGQFISSGTALLLAVAFANLVPKETYGIYKYVLSIAGILGAFTLTGLGTAITQSVARGFEYIIKDAFWLNLKWNLGFILASAIGSIYYFLNDNIILSVSLLMIGAFTPLLSGFNLFASFLNGKKKFLETTTYWGAVNILSVTGLIFILFVTKNVLVILLIYFVLHTLLTGFFYFFTIYKNKPNFEKDDGVVNYAKHLSLINILGTIATHIDKILVFHYLGTVQLAIYAFAIAIPEQIRSLLKQVNTLAIPKFSRRATSEIQTGMAEKVLQLGIVIILAIVTYFFLAPYIFNFLFPEYTESIFYSQLFAISLLGAINVLPMSALQAKAQKKELYQINIFNSVSQIIFMFFGLYFYGLLGLVVARILSKFVVAGVSIFVFNRINSLS